VSYFLLRKKEEESEKKKNKKREKNVFSKPEIDIGVKADSFIVYCQQNSTLINQKSYVVFVIIK